MTTKNVFSMKISGANLKTAIDACVSRTEDIPETEEDRRLLDLVSANLVLGDFYDVSIDDLSRLTAVRAPHQTPKTLLNELLPIFKSFMPAPHEPPPEMTEEMKIERARAQGAQAGKEAAAHKAAYMAETAKARS